MTRIINMCRKNKACLIILVGCFIRIIDLIFGINGINQDEAYAGYEAYSLLNSGIDSHGYSYPMYFVSWGSGMNVLNSYLMIPFIAIFGLKAWVIRLPQLIVSCLSLIVFYKFLRKISNEKIALMGLLLLSLCPWHIMLSAWGLESNLLPGFLLFATYFMLKAADDSKFLIWSSIFYGACLYCYSAVWPIMPIIIILQVAYLIYIKQLKIDKYIGIFTLILGLMSLPAILFLLINKGYMNEIKTPFFSIPKLIKMRDSDISVTNIYDNIKTLCNILIKQDDGLITNVISKYGLYYKGMLVFALIGLVVLLKDIYNSIKKKEANLMFFVCIQFFASLILSALIKVNVNRINVIHMPIIIFIAYGIVFVIDKVVDIIKNRLTKKDIKKIEYNMVYALVSIVLFITAIFFLKFYHTTYKEQSSKAFYKGFDRALNHANRISEKKTIHVDDVSYSLLLFYNRYPVREFVDNVEYANYPAEFLTVSKINKYQFDFKEIRHGDIYICYKDRVKGNIYGFHTVEYDNYVLIYD